MTDAKMVVDHSPVEGSEGQTESLKRKRASASSMNENMSAEERESRIDGLQGELGSLIWYFKDVLLQKVDLDETVSSSCSVNGLIGCLLEGSDLPFSRLVDEIYEKVKKTRYGISIASVRSTVLLVGQRCQYGVDKPDADVLEDDLDECLWCWEARDLKVIPENQKPIVRIWRTGRKKIGERVKAVSTMISVLLRPDSHPNYKTDFMKASEKIAKVLSESEIRIKLENMKQKSGSDLSEKETKSKEKKLSKELERNKREVEKEKKRLDREHQKEILQNEKELKRQQDEAEKEERRRGKEETEMKRQLKRQQEEAEKEQRRREREEAEMKKKLAIKKQASIMERFLKIKKNNSSAQDDKSSSKAAPLHPSREGGDVHMHSAVTLSMDTVLSVKDGVDVNDLLRFHLDGWKKLGHSIQSGRSRHWGMRHRPKTLLIKELKLQGSSSEAHASKKVAAASKGTTCSDELSMEKLVDGLEESISQDGLCQTNTEKRLTDILAGSRTKKLLQFDKSHRPAYYGTMSKKSGAIGPRHPLKKDPYLDYDIDSDEEWEEEDPGESLSDCDEEEILEEGNIRTEDEDGSEDGFVVPDGYLSENEGVQVDSMKSDSVDDDARCSPRCKEDLEREEFRELFQQHKHLSKLTENALRKNHPFFILNLMHEKTELLNAEGLHGNPRLEQICLQALSIRPFSSGPPIEISTCPSVLDEDQDVELSESKGNGTPVTPAMVIQDNDLHKIVWSIQSCPHGINKVIESLQQQFPNVPKSQLRSKVREISDFVDNRWQVKKEVLDKLGISISPEKCGGQRTKGIAAFFSKRCLPPASGPMKTEETFPQTRIASHEPVMHSNAYEQQEAQACRDGHS